MVRIGHDTRLNASYTYWQIQTQRLNVCNKSHLVYNSLTLDQNDLQVADILTIMGWLRKVGSLKS